MIALKITEWPCGEHPDKMLVMAVKPQKQGGLRDELRELDNKFTAKMAALSRWVDAVEEDIHDGIPPTPLTTYLRAEQLVPDGEPTFSATSPLDGEKDARLILAHEMSQVFNAARVNGQHGKVTYLNENHGSVKVVHSCIERNYAQQIMPHEHDLERTYEADVKHQSSGFDDANTDDGYSPSHSSHGAFNESSRAIILPPHGECDYALSPRVVDQQRRDDKATKCKAINITCIKDTNLPKGRDEDVVATIVCKTRLSTESQHKSTCSVYNHMTSLVLDLVRDRMSTRIHHNDGKIMNLVRHKSRKFNKFAELHTIEMMNHIALQEQYHSLLRINNGGDYTIPIFNLKHAVQTRKSRVDDGDDGENRMLINVCPAHPKMKALTHRELPLTSYFDVGSFTVTK
ncbi:hypothetical protein VNI00_016629 [Paramarasmius palmivorus]|uniref:Uncharacterized protein n=1 Tax=Paramarasmius palmivorus TaxID=297713 RepID=A0AAW0BCQ1_9AGAR